MCVLEFLRSVSLIHNTTNHYGSVFNKAVLVINNASLGDGSWETEGVTTNGSFGSDGVTTTVRCSSTHLTSFAVLVDVAGGLMVIIKSILLKFMLV
jgi:hypothetical protein